MSRYYKNDLKIYETYILKKNDKILSHWIRNQIKLKKNIANEIYHLILKFINVNRYVIKEHQPRNHNENRRVVFGLKVWHNLKNMIELSDIIPFHPIFLQNQKELFLQRFHPSPEDFSILRKGNMTI